MYDKLDDFIFEIVYFHFLMEMFFAFLPMVYTFRNLIGFARVCSHVDAFNNRNTFLTCSERADPLALVCDVLL